VRLPEWIKTDSPKGLHTTKRLLRSFGLTTVCEEARCPNIGVCFSKPAATFMILGPKCTRNCGFCAVESAVPEQPDSKEPVNIALAARDMGLRYIVITSVTRDDLPDGGAEQFAETINEARKYLPDSKVEVLTPDFKGNFNDLMTVLRAKPHVFNHNMETVPGLYPVVRPLADYRRSLGMLEYAKKNAPDIYTKSGIMLGLGESLNETLEVLRDLRSVGCDIVTIGQYLRPRKKNLPVAEYIRPEVFESLRITALSMGFRHAASAPLVRSSMNAEDMYNI
jgi:lipoyl synthase